MTSPILITDRERAELEQDHANSLRWAPDRSWYDYLSGRIAPEGKLWVCTACGKTARDSFGNLQPSDPGWDESCMLNAKLVDTGLLVWNGGRVVRVATAGGVA